MPYVKLDCGMLDSTTWFDKDGRDIFITALLMATPKEFDDPLEQLEVNSLNQTGWSVPAGWYGFVDAASLGIIKRCGLPVEDGLEALERLGSPEVESRSQSFDGRRLVRIDGGFVVLNYINYREKDHTAAERQRRFRARQKERNAVTSRNITQAEAKAEASKPKTLGRNASTEFEEFWKAYPKKRKKKTAREIWMRKKPELSVLLPDVTFRITQDRRWVEGFIPDPTTYLNQERWTDEVETLEKKPVEKKVSDYAAELGLVQGEAEADQQFERRVSDAVTARMYGHD